MSDAMTGTTRSACSASASASSKSYAVSMSATISARFATSSRAWNAAEASRRRLGRHRSEAGLQEFLARLAALAARLLGTAEEAGELVVAVALGGLHVLLEPQGVVQRLLGEPHDVVRLVLRAGDLTGFLR